MRRRTPRAAAFLAVLLIGTQTAGQEAGNPPGNLEETPVRLPARLPWEPAAQSLAAGLAPAQRGYEPAGQTYRLFAPAEYDGGRAWPLLLFVCPGDAPLEWEALETLSRRQRIFLAVPYRAGSACPEARRCRIVVDVLDDVRRRYRVDPAQTYLGGRGSGAEVAWSVAGTLPEYAGGVLAVNGAGPEPPLRYLRHRVGDRVSFALVTGPSSPFRDAAEKLHVPALEARGVRTRLWLTRMSREMPPTAVLEEALAWLAADLDRRRADAQRYPALNVGPADALTDREQTERMLRTAEAELVKPGHFLRGVALLEGIVARWGRTEAAEKAREQLALLAQDPERSLVRKRLEAEEDVPCLRARARGLERLGSAQAALEEWRKVLALGQSPQADDEARREVGRLEQMLTGRPYLGAVLRGASLVIGHVVPGGPADRAGLRAGDRLTHLGDADLSSQADLRQALGQLRPGAAVACRVIRAEEPHVVSLTLGASPLEAPERPGREKR